MNQTHQSDAKRSRNTAPESSRPGRKRQNLVHGGGLAQLAAMMNGSARVTALTQLQDAIQPQQRHEAQGHRGSALEDSQNGPAGLTPGEHVIQCLMSGESFSGRYQNKDATGKAIEGLLARYEKAWGAGYGTLFGEYDGKTHRQERIQILADLERTIHEHFRDSGAQRISGAPNSALMLELLDEVQAEHEKQIGELLPHKDELPVAAHDLSQKDQAKALNTWQSIVAGAANLKINETERNKGTGLERNHPGFRVKALSSIARLLQGPEGRKLIKQANEGGADPTQNITIAPVSNKPFDVVEGSLWSRQKKGTIPAGIWDAEPLKQSDASLKDAAVDPSTLLDLDSAGDAISAYERAAQEHQKSGSPKGVILGGKQSVFSKGAGSTVGYIEEHKDSENRVMTVTGKEGLSPTSVGLGHELGHAVRSRRGAGLQGRLNFLQFLGLEEQQNLWSSTDEELVNITSVENKLLVEKGLEPRTYHKDYEESFQELYFIRYEKYQKSPNYQALAGDQIAQALQNKQFDLADNLLQREGF